MPLDHYVTLGQSGLRVSPMCLGAMTFGEEWGFGSSVAESESILARYLERGGNFIDTANGYTGGHSERIIGNFIAHDRARRDRVVIATKFFGNLYPGRPQRRWRQPQVADRRLRRIAAAPADRLHRPVLDARLGPADADRRDDARAGRPGARGQGALHRLLGHARVEGGAGTDRGGVSRLDAAGGAAARILAHRADRRGRVDAGGARAGIGRDAVVAARRRAADGQVHARAHERRHVGPRRLHPQPAERIGADAAGRAAAHRQRD